jgi:hypothetical protein
MSKEIDLTRKQQISATVDGPILWEIMQMAAKEKRSASNMASILLEQAVKERQRQRKKNAKDSTDY